MTAERRSYLYDPIGNRKAAYVGSSLSMNPAYTRNSLNQYTATVNPSESFTYDEDGNMTEDGTFEYTWNRENRLIQVEPKTAASGDLRLTFAYDYIGRRVQKVQEEYDGSSWSTNAVTKFVWDGWLLIVDPTSPSVASKDWRLDGKDSDALTRTHTWGLDLSGTCTGAGGIRLRSGSYGGQVRGLLMVDDEAGDGFCGYYAYDGNGNVGQALDADDLSTDAHYEYDRYGRAIVATGTYADDNPWRFSTKWLDVSDPDDDDASLLYFGHRYLSRRLGRWMSRDPQREHGSISRRGSKRNRTGTSAGTRDGTQMAFSANCPTTRRDALGLCVIWVTCKLKSQTGSCHKDCLYECEEDPKRAGGSRQELPYTSGTPCADVPVPYVTAYRRRAPGVMLFGKCCKAGNCEAGPFEEATNVGGPGKLRCSRTECKQACKDVAAISKKSCAIMPNPAACKALVAATKQACINGCEFCQDE